MLIFAVLFFYISNQMVAYLLFEVEKFPKNKLKLSYMVLFIPGFYVLHCVEWTTYKMNELSHKREIEKIKKNSHLKLLK